MNLEARLSPQLDRGLLAGYATFDPTTRFPAFAFRLHQFISRGDTVYATAEPESSRHVTLEPQTFVPERFFHAPSGQVSAPGSPGRGTVWNVHNSLPVFASQPRMSP